MYVFPLILFILLTINLLCKPNYFSETARLDKTTKDE